MIKTRINPTIAPPINHPITFLPSAAAFQVNEAAATNRISMRPNLFSVPFSVMVSSYCVAIFFWKIFSLKAGLPDLKNDDMIINLFYYKLQNIIGHSQYLRWH